MKQQSCSRYLCCSRDLTTATRIIGFVGISVSVLLVTVLLNDSKASNYDISRKVAMALGLDWRHVHPYASTTLHDDPEGTMISAITIFSATAFLLTNGCLLIASVLRDPSFAVPWLICEMFGCVSKLAALGFHVFTEREKISDVFVVGSIIYIAVMIWWWFVVFEAQSDWLKIRKQTAFEMSDYNKDGDKETSSILQKSPEGYRANSFYATI